MHCIEKLTLLSVVCVQNYCKQKQPEENKWNLLQGNFLSPGTSVCDKGTTDRDLNW